MLLLLASLFLFQPFQSHAGDRPKYGPQATPLSQSHEYLAGHPAPDYWSLAGFYVSQKDEGACGPASLTMVLNALRAGQPLKASDRLITQADLYSKMDIYKEGGDLGSYGVSLDGIGRL